MQHFMGRQRGQINISSNAVSTQAGCSVHPPETRVVYSHSSQELGTAGVCATPHFRQNNVILILLLFVLRREHKVKSPVSAKFALNCCIIYLRKFPLRSLTLLPCFLSLQLASPGGARVPRGFGLPP